MPFRALCRNSPDCLWLARPSLSQPAWVAGAGGNNSLGLLVERALLEQASFTIAHHLLLTVFGYQQSARV